MTFKWYVVPGKVSLFADLGKLPFALGGKGLLNMIYIYTFLSIKGDLLWRRHLTLILILDKLLQVALTVKYLMSISFVDIT